MSQKSVENYPRVGVGVFVIRDGKFLMGKRIGSHGAETWSIPGGWIEYGETLEQAAAREVREETSMKITRVTFAALTNNIFRKESIHSLTVWMTSNWAAGEPSITEQDKFIEQRWVDIDNLPEPLFLPWEQLLTSTFIPAIRTRIKESDL
jgi:8-oxo-dGTP diphosphatase